MSSDFSEIRALRAAWVHFRRRKPSVGILLLVPLPALLRLIVVPPWPPCKWFTRFAPTGLRGSFEIWSLDFFIHFFCAALLSPREIPRHRLPASTACSQEPCFCSRYWATGGGSLFGGRPAHSNGDEASESCASPVLFLSGPFTKCL